MLLSISLLEERSKSVNNVADNVDCEEVEVQSENSQGSEIEGFLINHCADHLCDTFVYSSLLFAHVILL